MKKNRPDQDIIAALYSEEFRRRTALVILPAVVASALGVGIGCAGFNVYADSACDPLRHQRHDQHIEQTTTSASSAVVALAPSWRV